MKKVLMVAKRSCWVQYTLFDSPEAWYVDRTTPNDPSSASYKHHLDVKDGIAAEVEWLGVEFLGREAVINVRAVAFDQVTLGVLGTMYGWLGTDQLRFEDAEFDDIKIVRVDDNGIIDFGVEFGDKA